jgi:hypothetical protein
MLEYWTTRQDAEASRTLDFITDVVNYFGNIYGELPNFMLRYIETPLEYNGYVQRPMILMDAGVMDPVVRYDLDEFSSAPSDIQFYVTHMVHEISHLWFPGDTITGSDILGLWGESFAHVAETECVLNHFKLPSSHLQRFVRQYEQLGDLIGSEPALVDLVRDSLDGKAWDPIRRGKAVIILFAFAEQVGWDNYGDSQKRILTEGRKHPVTHDWIWDEFLVGLPEDRFKSACRFLDCYVFRKPSQEQFAELCRNLGLEFPSSPK